MEIVANVLENSVLKELSRSDFEDISYGQPRLLSLISAMYFACSFAHRTSVKTPDHYFWIGAVLGYIENKEFISMDTTIELDCRLASNYRLVPSFSFDFSSRQLRSNLIILI